MRVHITFNRNFTDGDYAKIYIPMKNLLTWLALPLLMSSCAVFAPVAHKQPAVLKKGGEAPAATVSNDARLEYVLKYKDIARKEMLRSGIPASITLAQGVLESRYGTSELVLEAKNHFGIKCGANWRGGVYEKQDDENNPDGSLRKSCFRKYDSDLASFEDHSDFLTDPRKVSRYGSLFNLEPTDYRGWAAGLQAAGYATNTNYAERLIKIIEDLQLYDYDQLGTESKGEGAIEETEAAVSNAEEKIHLLEARAGKINGLRVVLAKNNETPADVAKAFDLPVEEVLAFNENHYREKTILKKGTPVYLQPKKNRFSGRITHHEVKKGQTLFSISQQYGIKSAALATNNGLALGTEPAPGSVLLLKGKRGAAAPGQAIADKAAAAVNADTVSVSGRAPDKRPDSGDINWSISGDGKVIDTEKNKAAAKSNPRRSEPTLTEQPMPEKLAERPPAPSQFHVVVQGDTLYQLSRRYSTTVEILKSLNNLTSDTLSVGQRLKVK
jgi:LysM repeat protein